MVNILIIPFWFRWFHNLWTFLNYRFIYFTIFFRPFTISFFKCGVVRWKFWFCISAISLSIFCHVSRLWFISNFWFIINFIKFNILCWAQMAHWIINILRYRWWCCLNLVCIRQILLLWIHYIRHHLKHFKHIHHWITLFRCDIWKSIKHILLFIINLIRHYIVLTNSYTSLFIWI